MATAIFYILAYLTLSFFPYDFVTSFQELQYKQSFGNDSFFISNSCGDFIRCSSKLSSEIILILPLGIFCSVFLKQHPKKLTAIILIGFLLGLFIEGIQLFIISGIAQGVSIITRITGMYLGAIIYKKISQLEQPFAFLNTINLKKYLIILALPYILVLAHLSGWSFAENAISSSVAENFDKINWLPFYYHYYTTEAVALTSLLSILAMYFPIGIGLWLWKYHKIQAKYQYLQAGLYATGLCFIMESGKLFFVQKHPDPTNLIISFVAAAFAYFIVQTLYRWFHQPTIKLAGGTSTNGSENSLQTQFESKQVILTNEATAGFFAKGIASVLLTLTIWQLLNYPGSFAVLLALLVFYAIALYKYPQAWLIALPALLPVADLSPWTGRLFFTEFDYFFLLTLVISLWRGRWRSPFKIIKTATLFLLGIYILFYTISLMLGLFPLQALDANAFTNYYSYYNSLRVAKGFFWALLLLPLLAYHVQHKQNLKAYFSYGILTGLAATSFFALWERTIFTGLFDFSTGFRISSTFYSMHTGGAHLDAYLVLSIPFICFLFIESKNLFTRTVFPTLLFSISFYTLLVTFTRASYIAIAISLMTLVIGLFICYKQVIAYHWKKTLGLATFTLLIISSISLTILNGSFIQHRFSQTAHEIDVRSNHWLDVKEMMDDDFFTSLFGMGLGSFPRTYLWNDISGNAPATFSLQQEKKQLYLQIGSGSPLYIEQHIDIAPFSNYKLSFDYRMQLGNSRLNIMVCEKAIQNSFNCQKIPLKYQNKKNQWQHIKQSFNSGDIGKTDNPFNNKPTKLILFNSQQNSLLDIKNINLISTEKRKLLKNGGFSKGMDHWFFTADRHIPWRAENLWVQMLFEQGWLGLIVFNLILLQIIVYLYHRIVKQDYFAAISLSAFTGFMVIGMTDSPFDMPMITLLFFMIYFIALIETDRG